MFTQLDLFGDLPAPEKPSNQPQRAEKKSPVKAGNAAGTSVQTQLSMGLTEHTYPEPSRGWTEQEETKPTSVPELADTVTSEQIGDDFNNNVAQLQTPPGPSALIPIEPKPPALQANQQPITDIAKSNQEIQQETRAEKGQRYYIQTEIPADPPLAAKPPGPEVMMAGLVNTRTTAQEPKPRYIQTEIPSDPIQTEINSDNSPEAEQVVARPTPVIQDPSVRVPITQHSSPKDDPVPVAKMEDVSSKPIPAESLRRTRPLMPPRVILAEPDQPESINASLTAKTNANPFINPEPKKEDPKPDPPTIQDKKATEGELFPLNSDTAIRPSEKVATPIDADHQKSEPNKPQPIIRRKKVVKEPVMDISGPGVPPDDQLNARQYYSIGEVATMFGVKSSLLRYWESEFDVLKLRKNRKGDRFFRPDDIRSLQLIHHLLRDKKYTIEGAREYMRNAGKMKEKFETIETLQRIRQFLVEMRNGLQTDRIPEAH